MSKNGFTPIQLAMLKLLSDGKPHTRNELHACLSDELSSLQTVSVHLCGIRKLIRLKGEDIICVFWKRRIGYQHVQIISYDG